MSASSDTPQPSSSAAYSAQELLRRRDAILGGVARATELISQTSHWRECAQELLHITGEATGVSRVYIFEIRRDATGVLSGYQTFEWAAPGVSPQIDNPDLQGIPFEAAGFGRWIAAFERGEPIFGDIADFPPEEQPILESQQILSLLVQPIRAGRHLWGMIGFDACARPQRWERVEVDALRIAAVAFGAAVQREEREAQLQQLQRLEALGRMAGGVAHDFNNVLAVASGATEMLAGELGARGVLDKDSRDLLEALQQALAQGAGLTRRLLQFSRQRQGQPRDVEVFETLRAATPLLRQILGHAITLELRGSTGLPPIHIDPVDLEQVMLNLVVNARDAMASDGKLTIEVGSFEATEDDGGPDGLAPGRWVRVFVRDTGCGMSAEVRKRIFEPFFTTKSADRGTGLGLSTVFAIVHGQGGRIAVATRPGEGTEFRLYFPASLGR
ncbi:MAG: sensor histidine kinase [Planctomycetota bacterium]